MRFARIEARSFGKLPEGEAFDIPDGLVIVHGPNEAGKSTRMDLIRFVLFGDAGLETSKRMPANGGKRAASIDVVADDGRLLRIVRHERDRMVLDADGQPASEIDIDALIGDVRGSIYRAVQTFDSASISSDKLLKTAAVREELLMSALLGSGESATKAIDALKSRADAIFLRQGKLADRPYAVRLAGLKQAREERSAAKSAFDDYPTLRKRAEAARDALDAARARRAAATDALAAHERRVAVRDALRRVAELEGEAPPAAAPVPEALVELERTVSTTMIAADARLAAANHAAERVAEHEDAITAARAALGVSPETSAPDAGGIGRLDAAADAVGRASAALDDAERRLGEAQSAELGVAQAATDEDAVPPTGRPRAHVLSAALGALGLIAVLVGLAVASRAAGGVGALCLAAALALALGSGRRGAAVVPPALDAAAARMSALTAERAAARDAAGQALVDAQAAWVATVAALGLPDGLGVGQLDEVREASRAFHAAAGALPRAREERREAEAVLEGLLEPARKLLLARGESVPADPAALVAAATHEAGEVAREIADAATGAGAVASHAAQLAEARAAIPADVEPEQLVELASLGDDDVARLRDEIDRALREADEALEIAIAERTEADGALRAGQDSDAVAAAGQAVESAIEELRVVVDRWLVAELARQIVARTRDDAIRDRQRPVTARASELVGPATGGYWTELEVGEEGATPIVRGPGRAIPFAELSAGAAAVVYLCLRLGLVEAFERTLPEPLPLVMDDTLTHLDDERRAGVAGVIAEIAKTRQVLYFTCHQEHVDALRAADPGARVLPVGRFD